jgi:formylmethanofuran dehydrogenase subunit B
MTGQKRLRERTVEDVTCLGCGCACDDIEVVVRDEQIAEARNACSLGVSWFGDGLVPARARVAGRDASLDEALEAIARLLSNAGRPAIYLAPDVSCETQREAIALADTLRATLDSVTSTTAIDALLAAQERGRAGATLGEMRNRSDVIVWWGVDPASRYPRYAIRYTPEAAGLEIPNGRRSRTVVAVDVGDRRGPADADLRVATPAADEVSMLTALAALVSGAVRARRAKAEDWEGETPWAGARRLAPTLLAARYATVVADAEPQPGRDRGWAAALIALAQALNSPTRCALSLLRGGGNRSGADFVVTSQTGYPTAVDFARGFPQYRPWDGTSAVRLESGGLDAVLIIGSVAGVPQDLCSAMNRVACAVVGPRASESVLGAQQAIIDTAVAGIHESGTACRMDDVPLPLRQCLDGPPPAAALVRRLVGLARRPSV